jgi:hypothetical protein
MGILNGFCMVTGSPKTGTVFGEPSLWQNSKFECGTSFVGKPVVHLFYLQVRRSTDLKKSTNSFCNGESYVTLYRVPISGKIPFENGSVSVGWFMQSHSPNSTTRF